ncbi:MAG: alkaline phosphatase family protein [Bacilli bacterium]|nr:alkaline phosphatase family protein [Bacilli bacterium]
MKKFILPNYEDSIVNLACSIRKYFEIDYKHKTLKDIDDLLKNKQPKNVVVILYDGMGYNLVKRNIPGSFLDKHMTRSFSSVAPATTTASTTSIITGKYPKEHGWLGWDLYFEPLDKIVTMFTNCYKDTETKVADHSVAWKYYYTKTIMEEINEAGKYSARYISPYGDIKYDKLNEMLDLIYKECQSDGRKYIYAYHPEPDSSMHELGTDHKNVLKLFKEINDKTEEMCNKLGDDTVVIIVADHGHLNSEGILLDDYPDFKDTLDGDIWIEGRLCSFRVKDENNFKKLFKKYFSKDFELYTKKEIIDMKLFGIGNNEHELFRKSLGDYFALAKENKYFRYCEESVDLKSMHAGFTEDEMLIPLIVYYK